MPLQGVPLRTTRARFDGSMQLFISKKAAGVHVSNLMRKLGVSNRIEAGELGQQVGLGNA
jgi:ATP/maltotriose-dependent transcriptional regulator MalT